MLAWNARAHFFRARASLRDACALHSLWPEEAAGLRPWRPSHAGQVALYFVLFAARKRQPGPMNMLFPGVFQESTKSIGYQPKLDKLLAEHVEMPLV